MTYVDESTLPLTDAEREELRWDEPGVLAAHPLATTDDALAYFERNEIRVEIVITPKGWAWGSHEATSVTVQMHRPGGYTKHRTIRRRYVGYGLGPDLATALLRAVLMHRREVASHVP